MFVTVDNAHAREWLSLPSISTITLCWRNAAAVMKETMSIAGHLENNIIDSAAAIMKESLSVVALLENYIRITNDSRI